MRNVAESLHTSRDEGVDSGRIEESNIILTAALFTHTHTHTQTNIKNLGVSSNSIFQASAISIDFEIKLLFRQRS